LIDNQEKIIEDFFEADKAVMDTLGGMLLNNPPVNGKTKQVDVSMTYSIMACIKTSRANLLALKAFVRSSDELIRIIKSS